MKFARFTRGTLSLLAVGGLAWGCSSKSSDCTANKNCSAYDGGAAGTSGVSGKNGIGGNSGSGDGAEAGSAGDGGGTSGVGGSSGASGNAGSGGAPCVGTAAPDAAQCVIGDEYGLFVSLSGDDTNGDGSEAKPFATVTKALSATGPGKINRVYVCSTASGSATSYVEPDTLVIPDRVSIYGGFTCAGGTWGYDATVKSVLKPASPVGALISGALNSVTVQDLEIDAADAPPDGTGASSFGMIVKGSKGVALTRVEIHAGKGGKGATGADGVGGVDGDPSLVPQNGTVGTCTSPPTSQPGGVSIVKKCGSQGGNGGVAFTAVSYSYLQDGAPGFLVDPTNGGTGAHSVTDPGGVGLPGPDGAVGVRGVLSTGAFAASGYSVASGGNGTVGEPGKGGGGGGASLGTASCVGASGGAGGMGGCGGDPGLGGTGGGASVALMSWSSALTLDDCTFVAATAGAGGDGGSGHIGGTGQTGGSGGPAKPENSLARGGAGGLGGNGGNGGNGAAGSGGPSISVVFSGAMPTEVNGQTYTHAASGASGGKGGRLGSSANWAPDGLPGALADEYEQK